MAINAKLLARLATVADDLDAGGHLAALGGLDGLEREIDTHAQFPAPASVGAQHFHNQPITQRRSYDTTESSTRKSAARISRAPARNRNLQPQAWIKKTPVEVVLEQIGKQEQKVAEMREELAHEERELAKLQQARKVLEAQ